MRKTFLAIGLVGALAAPSLANATCQGTKATGTVLGGLGGGIIGAAAATTPWGFAAAGMGALVGHLIAAATCPHFAAAGYYKSEHYPVAYGYYHPGYYHPGYYHPGYYHRGYYDRYGYYHRGYYYRY